jgi:hypothetical protein
MKSTSLSLDQNAARMVLDGNKTKDLLIKNQDSIICIMEKKIDSLYSNFDSCQQAFQNSIGVTYIENSRIKRERNIWRATAGGITLFFFLLLTLK